MVRKVTEISLTWQRKTFKTTSRLRSAERGVEDVLKQGVGTRSREPGSSREAKGLSGRSAWPASTVLPRVPLPSLAFRRCAGCHAAARSRGVTVLRANRGCNNIRPKEGPDFRVISMVRFISANP